ncbi:Protein of unknown function [Catalinimonas alkaloidigena]|uniref:DUF3667 domain-containing protein n=1 Tax=Catalinimonas alkaloidigena TaxID=1075417 RepID=A0A1G9IYB7_9BACT|nr:DUF3667 domain-containing protein [Catalinimonas alkaloidigena]SDL30247.1 Protein of unknown function [Catalinimonas alkaloidigena]
MPLAPPTYEVCPNCATPLPDRPNYCPTCGQQNRELRVSFRDLIGEYLGSAFNVDAKAARTFRDLLGRPGHMIRAFNEGKRVRYVPPVRLYLFVSALFFLLTALLSTDDRPRRTPIRFQSDGDSIGITTMQDLDSVELPLRGNDAVFLQSELAQIAGYSNEQLDSLLSAKSAEPTFLNRLMVRRAVRLLHAEQHSFVDQFFQIISVAMFFLMPIFAFWLWLLYRRSSRYYFEHLIFAIYFHSLVFLLMIVQAGVELIPAIGELINALIGLLILVYLLLALKQAYQQGWGRTVAKFFLLLMVYGLTLLVSFAVSGFMSLLIF